MVVLDLSSVVHSVAGPKRPQDRVDLKEMKKDFEFCLRNTVQAKLNTKEFNYLIDFDLYRLVSEALAYRMMKSNVAEASLGTMEKYIHWNMVRL